MPYPQRRLRLEVLVCALAGMAALGAGAIAADGDLIVSQKDRAFNPAAVTVRKGGAITIVNDDGTMLHHAYIESDTFNYDSGDQKPGGRATIVFPIAGRFTVPLRHPPENETQGPGRIGRF